MSAPTQDIIQKWFSDHWGGSLLLPDGWFGRPYDNKHSLTTMSENGDEFTLVLDAKLTLRFEGLKAVEVQGQDLVLGPFDKLTFQWESFGSPAAHGNKEYRSGEAKISGGPS